MVNCHLLKFEASRVIEARLSNLADVKVKYGLAFIYDEEVKDARIRAYLDKQLVRNFAYADKDRLKAYVQGILKVPEEVTTTACCMDKDR